MPKMHKLLIICDRPDWAFQKICDALIRYCVQWEIVVRYGPFVHHFHDHDAFDLLLYLLDYAPGPIKQYPVPKEKLMLAIRSHVLDKKYPGWADTNWLQAKVGGIIVANQFLREQFSVLHDNVYLAQGGTDTDFFVPGRTCSRDRWVVGWAGSRNNFGAEHRGIPIVEEACKKAGLIFRPAYRETKWRTAAEMLAYYQDEIDIYVDLSETAGRQNGLLEAGACGKLLIASTAGISKELIHDGWNGHLVERTSSALVEKFKTAGSVMETFGSRIRTTVEKSWSWKTHATIFERAFHDMLSRKEY